MVNKNCLISTVYIVIIINKVNFNNIGSLGAPEEKAARYLYSLVSKGEETETREWDWAILDAHYSQPRMAAN